jgi:hypothetical protein
VCTMVRTTLRACDSRTHLRSSPMTFPDPRNSDILVYVTIING